MTWRKEENVREQGVATPGRNIPKESWKAFSRSVRLGKVFKGNFPSMGQVLSDLFSRVPRTRRATFLLALPSQVPMAIGNPLLPFLCIVQKHFPYTYWLPRMLKCL